MPNRWEQWYYIPYTSEEKMRVVFLFQAASAWASWESVYNACMADEEMEARILLLTEQSVEKAQMLSAGDFLMKKNLPYELYENFDIDRYRPHIAFVQFPYDVSYHTPNVLSLRLRQKGIRIAYVPYGIEISDEENARRDHFENFVVENSCWIFTCCEILKEEYKKYCRNREAVRVCGSPKFDGLAYRENYPLAQEYVRKADGRKIVLWKMHFPKKISANGKIVQITPQLEEYIRFAGELESHKDLFFIVMAHPKMLYGMADSDLKGDNSLREKTERLLEIIRTQENAVLDVSDDYRNALYHADAIMLDRSALMVEAAMTGKPVLLMKNNVYQERWTEGVRQVSDTFSQGSKKEDMEAFLETVRMKKDSGQKKSERILERFFPYRDGRCGWRIKELIKKELGEEACGQTDGKIRMALYGAGEVCKYYLTDGLKRTGCDKDICEIVTIVDGNPLKWGTEFYGCRIEPPEILQEADYDVVVIMTEQNYFEIKKKLVYDLFIDERKIWRLDEFLCGFGKSL